MQGLVNLDFFRNLPLAIQPRLWLPTLEIDSILELPVGLPNHVKAIVFDVDQTILPFNMLKVSKVIRAHIKQLSSGYACCLLSNYPKTLSRMKRLEAVRNQLNLPLALSSRNKPDLEAFHAAQDILHVERSEMAIVGDRVLTDVLGGNNYGIVTVLVKPILPSADPFLWVAMPRRIEQFFLSILKLIYTRVK